MKVQSCKRIATAVGVLALTFLSALPVQARPDTWKIDSIASRGVGGDIVRTIYVPRGAQWTGASLHVDVEPAADSYLGVWLDGNRIMRRQFDQGGSVDLDVGNLASGFHKIMFRIAQQKLLSGNGSDLGVQQDDCRVDAGGTFVLKNVALRYFQSASHATLSDLPEALFNPQLPGATAWQGMIVADPTDTLSASVAARLASGWQATAGIHWNVAKSTNADTAAAGAADFVVQLVHDAGLTVPARLELVPAHVADSPVVAASVAPQDPGAEPAQAAVAQTSVPALLRISFRDEGGAFSAANALLNGSYLAQLDTQSVDLTHAVAAPSWAGEKAYKTLADFGVQDISLGAQPNASLFLPVPAAWQPTGMASGKLAYRVQEGLLQGSALRLWIDNALTGSSVLYSRDIKPSNGNLDFHSDRVPSGKLLAMYLDSHMLVTQQCLPGYNGDLWINADKSEVEIPHRYKAGVAALQTALMAKPNIRIDGQPASLSAALALASSMHDLVGNHPLPFRIVGAQDTSTPVPVSIAVDAAAYRQQAGQHADTMASGLLGQGTLIELAGSDYKVVSSDTDSLRGFAGQWSNSRHDIADGMNQVFMNVDGAVVTPALTPVVAALAVSTGDHYQLLVYLGLALLLLVVLGAWLLSRRR